MTVTEKRGGKRENSGRKSDPSKLARVKVSICEKLEALGLTPNQALELFLSEKLNITKNDSSIP